MTLNISNFTDNAEIPDDVYLSRLRNSRDQELFDTDWTQLSDSPVNKTAWAVYRQSLRDMFKGNLAPRSIIIPIEPTL